MPFMVRSVLLGLLVATGAVLAAATRGAFPRIAPLAGDPRREGAVPLMGPARLAEPGSATGGGVCGGFSAEGRYDNVPVAWSFRLCEIAEHAYEVQLRFRNVSRRPARPVRFAYRVWSEPPGTCDGTESERSSLLAGEKKLRPGEIDEWPYAVGVVLRRAYRGEIWSCAIPRS